MKEFTVRAVLTGAILGLIFGASSLYLVLKVGLTVSASIPVAVISLAMFRGWAKVGGRDATILENNITQTAGSAGESLAFGIGVTMPAILILGFDLELTRVMLVAMLGGLLGILMMIPLRRALIVKEHGVLKYPEGTACAAVLKAGGIISLVQSMPTIWHGLMGGLRDLGLSRGNGHKGEAVPRTDQDLSMKFVGIGIVALIAVVVLAPSLHMNILGALLIVLFGFLFVTVSSRLTGEIGSSSNPISGMTVATLLFTCLVFLLVGWTGGTHYVTALSVGAIVCIAASNGGSTSQDLKTGHLLGATPRYQQIAIMVGSLLSALLLGPVLLKLNESATVYVPAAQVAPAGLHAAPGALGPTEGLAGPQARDDSHLYRVWQKTDDVGGPAGRYLVNDDGKAVWLVDPGINGAYNTRPDGTTVRKFDAPKATLMSYIIKGILDRKLPWALVLLGVMIAVTLQLSFVPALAFAVGVYLPISSSTPIFFGGLIRWLVDRHTRQQASHAELTEEQFAAESDKSSGVLLASGYIAGGAIAGIIIAFLAGVMDRFDAALNTWSLAHNPFFNGPNSDALSLLPFLVLCVLLYFVGREKLLVPKKQ